MGESGNISEGSQPPSSPPWQSNPMYVGHRTGKSLIQLAEETSRKSLQQRQSMEVVQHQSSQEDKAAWPFRSKNLRHFGSSIGSQGNATPPKPRRSIYAVEGPTGGGNNKGLPGWRSSSVRNLALLPGADSSTPPPSPPVPMPSRMENESPNDYEMRVVASLGLSVEGFQATSDKDAGSKGAKGVTRQLRHMSESLGRAIPKLHGIEWGRRKNKKGAFQMDKRFQNLLDWGGETETFDAAMERIVSTNSRFPIIMPWSLIRQRLEFVLMILVCYNSVYAPLKLVFRNPAAGSPLRHLFDIGIYALDALMLVYTISSFFTAYVDTSENVVIARPRLIAR